MFLLQISAVFFLKSQWRLKDLDKMWKNVKIHGGNLIFNVKNVIQNHLPYPVSFASPMSNTWRQPCKSQDSRQRQIRRTELVTNSLFNHSFKRYLNHKYLYNYFNKYCEYMYLILPEHRPITHLYATSVVCNFQHIFNNSNGNLTIDYTQNWF